MNVFTTGVTASRCPVMVWLHGGAYQSGTGNIYDGAALAKKGVVVVTVNYRLGALGCPAHAAFASEDAHGSTGNYGLLDQVAALRWVRRHIDRFGGDSTRITVFGQSAGGYSVGALLASPLARQGKGRFHPWPTQSRQEAQADLWTMDVESGTALECHAAPDHCHIKSDRADPIGRHLHQVFAQHDEVVPFAGSSRFTRSWPIFVSGDVANRPTA